MMAFFGRNNIKKSLSLCTALLLSSACSTVAEKNEVAARESFQSVNQKFQQCLEFVSENRRTILNSLAEKTGTDLNSLSAERLSDQTRPSQIQIESIFGVLDAYRPCEQTYWSDLSSVAPRLAIVHRRFVDDRTQVAVALKNERLTWGEYNRRRLSNFRSFQEAHRIAAEATARDYAAASELSRRERSRAADNLSRVGNELLRDGAAPRPITTNCLRNPLGYSCTTN
jgi:hypothetical protein